jgi:RNA polymerase sigma-70 factor, ECF subfamily
VESELTARGVEPPEDLADAVAEIRARWPHAPEPDARFAEFLAARLAARPPIADVFLAWWCTTGDAAAITAFEAWFDADLRIATARFSDLPADELRQVLRIKLFVGAAGARPVIHDYSGRGALRSWVRVIAVRCFVDVIRATRAQRNEAELDEAELLGLGDPAGAQLGAELAAAVKRAFAAAVAALTPRQRVFLRHAYVDRHTLEQIAALYGLHRATVARTLTAAREHLVAATRAGVVDVIRIDPDELTSVIRALDSRIELSLSRVLAPAGRHEPM